MSINGGNCYCRGLKKVSVLNRWDQLVKIFTCFKSAEKFENENQHLINKYINMKEKSNDLYFIEPGVEIKQVEGLDLKIINPDFKKDNIEIWCELQTDDPQVIFIERKNIDAVIAALEKCKD